MQERDTHHLSCHIESLTSPGRDWVVHVVEPVIAAFRLTSLAALIRRVDGVVRNADGTLDA